MKYKFELIYWKTASNIVKATESLIKAKYHREIRSWLNGQNETP